MENDVLVRVQNLSKTFKGEKAPSLKNISLELKTGEMAALAGPDGAGKTTFMRLLCGLLLPDGANSCESIEIAGFCPSKDLYEIKKLIGYMPQKFGLYEDLTVIENLNLYSKLNCKNAVDQSEIDTLLEFAGLIDFKTRITGKLSGGMKQKLGLCCTLVSKPRLLLLDEPSVGVDPLSRRELMQIVEKLVKDNNITVLWSTSYLDEAEKFGRVFLFSNGEKLYDGMAQDAAKSIAPLVFSTQKEGVNNRSLLRNILRVCENMGKPLADAVIQGDKIRLVFSNENSAQTFFMPKTPAKPEFEDFVIYKLKQNLNTDNVQTTKNLLKSNFWTENDKKIRNSATNSNLNQGMPQTQAPSAPYGSYQTPTHGISQTPAQTDVQSSPKTRSQTPSQSDSKDPRKNAPQSPLPPRETTISAKGLTKIYGKGEKRFIAAQNISFEIKKGEIFGLLGPNGAGKSTTFKMLCGLIRPTSGTSSIMGVSIDENPTLAKSYLGYTAQKFSLFGNLSVKQNLDFFAGVYGLKGALKAEKTAMLLNFFDLEKYYDTNANDLPLGYKQRLALSCAVIHNPPVLFLDEPTSGVDPLSRREFWQQINSLSEGGTTILTTTHFMDEAQFCDRICMIFKGHALVTATPDELKNSVKTEQNPHPTMEDAFINLILNETAGVK